MRLFLDAHLSGRRIALPLRQRGHDVRAADEERELDGVSDADLFNIARTEGRIIVTANVRDFRPIIVDWVGRGEHHPGCIFLSSAVRQEHFGVIVTGLIQAFAARPLQESWIDHEYWLPHGA